MGRQYNIPNVKEIVEFKKKNEVKNKVVSAAKLAPSIVQKFKSGYKQIEIQVTNFTMSRPKKRSNIDESEELEYKHSILERTINQDISELVIELQEAGYIADYVMKDDNKNNLTMFLSIKIPS